MTACETWPVWLEANTHGWDGRRICLRRKFDLFKEPVISTETVKRRIIEEVLKHPRHAAFVGCSIACHTLLHHWECVLEQEFGEYRLIPA